MRSESGPNATSQNELIASDKSRAYSRRDFAYCARLAYCIPTTEAAHSDVQTVEPSMMKKRADFMALNRKPP